MDPFQRDRLADGNRHANRGNQKIRHGQINHEVISHAENNKGDSFESFESSSCSRQSKAHKRIRWTLVRTLRPTDIGHSRFVEIQTIFY